MAQRVWADSLLMYIDEREEIAVDVSSIFLRGGAKGFTFRRIVSRSLNNVRDATIPNRVSKQKSDQ